MSITRTRTDADTRTDAEVDRVPADADSDAEVADDRSVRRRRSFRRQRDDDPTGAGPLAAVALTLGRLVRLAAGVVAAIIALGILFIVFDANSSNDIVSTVDDAARALVGPFDDMFSFDNAKTAVAVNWGIAALVYLIAGALIARLIEWVGTAPLRVRRA
jgi:hypothetical protein